jgi:hypothetical protein
MLEKEDVMGAPRSKVVTVHVTGPLAPLAAAFESMLSERGYTPLTRVRHLQVMVHLSRWLQTRQLDAAGLTGQRVEQYLDERRAAGYTAYCSRTSLSPLWELLALHGAPLGASPAGTVSHADVLLAGYSRFLREERGLASSTTAAYVARARRFLAEGVGEQGLGVVGAADVIGAVLRESAALSVGSTQFFVVALRVPALLLPGGVGRDGLVRGGAAGHRSPSVGSAAADQPDRCVGVAALVRPAHRARAPRLRGHPHPVTSGAACR